LLISTQTHRRCPDRADPKWGVPRGRPRRPSL